MPPICSVTNGSENPFASAATKPMQRSSRMKRMPSHGGRTAEEARNSNPSSSVGSGPDCALLRSTDPSSANVFRRCLSVCSRSQPSPTSRPTSSSNVAIGCGMFGPRTAACSTKSSATEMDERKTGSRNC